MALRACRALRCAGGLAAAALVGCATPARLELSPDELRGELARLAPELDPAEIVVPYELDSEPIARARQLIRGRPGRDGLLALVDGLSAAEAFGLRYEWAASTSAAETLASRRGNCFALSSVLIGLARGLGLNAFYVEVQVADPQWRQDGDLAVYADHIAAVIATARGRLFVDFSGRLAHAQRLRVIGDLEALAHYYNNRGYELLHGAALANALLPWQRSLELFELAIRVQPGMARAWNNLGVARARLGDDAGARQAYERALQLEEGIQSAHVNLAVLYLRQNSPAPALEHLRAAQRLDPRNPRIQDLLESVREENDRPDEPAGG